MPLGVGRGQMGLRDFAIFGLCCRRGHPCFRNTCLIYLVTLTLKFDLLLRSLLYFYFIPEEIGISYCAFVFLVTRQFTWYHNFLLHDLYLEVATSGGPVIKLLACLSRHLNFRDWVSPAFKSRYDPDIVIAT